MNCRIISAASGLAITADSTARIRSRPCGSSPIRRKKRTTRSPTPSGPGPTISGTSWAGFSGSCIAATKTSSLPSK
jgi:hypothetical protein